MTLTLPQVSTAKPELTLTEMIPAYVDYLRLERQLAPATVYAYRRDAELLAGRIGKPIRQITRDDLREYMRFLATYGYSPLTVRRMFGGYGTLFNWLYVDGHMPEVITQHLIMPRKKQVLPRWLSETEFQRFVATCFTTYAPLRIRAMWLFLARTGVRPGELLGLNVRDINPADWIVTVRNTKSRRDRALPIEDTKLQAMLDSLIDDARPDDPVFLNNRGQRWDRRSLQKIFNPHLHQANIPTKGVSPKTIRHTVGTHLALRGVPLNVIQEILGHRDLSTTQIYLHAAPGNLRSALAQLSEME